MSKTRCLLLLTALAFLPFYINVFRKYSEDEDLYDSCRQKTPLASEKAFDHLKTVTMMYRIPLVVSRTNCTQVNFSLHSLPKTPLASIPGSGNTWARHLIELISGVYSGSVYNDRQLAKDFPGERHTGYDVIVVKTHDLNIVGPHTRAVILIRDPVSAMKADHMRMLSTGRNHTGTAKQIEAKDWREAVAVHTRGFGKSTANWLRAAQKQNIDLFLLFYEDLVRNLDRALTNLAYFLGVELDAEILDCALRNGEGKYHRHKDVDLYKGIDIDTKEIDEERMKLRELIKQCIQQKTCGTSGCAFVEF